MEEIETLQDPEMHRRQIELLDGRYLLFYTFEIQDPAGSDRSLKDEEEVTR